MRVSFFVHTLCVCVFLCISLSVFGIRKSCRRDLQRLLQTLNNPLKCTISQRAGTLIINIGTECESHQPDIESSSVGGLWQAVSRQRSSLCNRNIRQLTLVCPRLASPGLALVFAFEFTFRQEGAVPAQFD